MIRVLARILKKVQECVHPGTLVDIQFFFPILKHYQTQESSINVNKWQELLEGVGGGVWPWRRGRAMR